MSELKWKINFEKYLELKTTNAFARSALEIAAFYLEKGDEEDRRAVAEKIRAVLEKETGDETDTD